MSEFADDRASQSRTTVAVIDASCASSFQKESGEKALRQVLQAWREFYSEKHQGNDIKIDIAQPDQKDWRCPHLDSPDRESICK